MKDIGKVIESKMQIKEMTQSELGKKLGLNQRTISQYVRGNTMPSLETLSKICEILEIDPSYILEIKEYDNSDLFLSDKQEISLIHHFRNVSSHDKMTILALAEILDKQS